MSRTLYFLLDAGVVDGICEGLHETLVGAPIEAVRHRGDTPTVSRAPNHNAVQTVSNARMTDGIVTLDIVFGVVDIVNKLLQAKTILILARILLFPDGGLHQLRTLFRDQTNAVVLAIVHMHHHIDSQIVSRDLHATRRREGRCRVTHNIVGHLIGRAAISVD